MKNGYYLATTDNKLNFISSLHTSVTAAFEHRKEVGENVVVVYVHGEFPTQNVMQVNRHGEFIGQSIPLAPAVEQIVDRVLTMLGGRRFAEWYGDGGAFDKFIRNDTDAPPREEIVKTLTSYFQ